jgi:hypothetical protein
MLLIYLWAKGMNLTFFEHILGLTFDYHGNNEPSIESRQSCMTEASDCVSQENTEAL